MYDRSKQADRSVKKIYAKCGMYHVLPTLCSALVRVAVVVVVVVVQTFALLFAAGHSSAVTRDR